MNDDERNAQIVRTLKRVKGQRMLVMCLRSKLDEIIEELDQARRC